MLQTRGIDIIDPIFIEMCVKEQNMLGTEEGIEKFLSILPNEEDRQGVKILLIFVRRTPVKQDGMYSYNILNLNEQEYDYI